jgi:CheY-like chemotaxis protein
MARARTEAWEKVSMASKHVYVRFRVLVIDDDPLVCSLLERALRPSFDVVVEGDPIIALEELFEHPRYDVILSDIQMPSASGTELLSVLRRARSPLAQRFVFMTGPSFPEEWQTFGRPVLRKPLSIAEVHTVLHRVALASPSLPFANDEHTLPNQRPPRSLVPAHFFSGSRPT